MAMPNNLILVRHGESEGNLANKLSREGDHSAFTEAFRQRHSSDWMLTDKGIWQAQTAGDWIKANIGGQFDRYYTSEYLRAIQTAVNLDLPGASWYLEFYLRERDMGVLDVMSHEERLRDHNPEWQRRHRDGFFWAPPGGESIANLCLRIDRVLATLHRECEGKDVIIVCHGEVMWAFRVRLERLSQVRYRELDGSSDPHDKIFNCQILHYTRVNPEGGTSATPYLGWFRSVCPTDLSLSRNEWEAIQRPRYSNTDLAAQIDSSKRQVNTINFKEE